jgi:hypothetical protein
MSDYGITGVHVNKSGRIVSASICTIGAQGNGRIREHADMPAIQVASMIYRGIGFSAYLSSAIGSCMVRSSSASSIPVAPRELNSKRTNWGGLCATLCSTFLPRITDGRWPPTSAT